MGGSARPGSGASDSETHWQSGEQVCVFLCVCVHNYVVHEYTRVHACARGVYACLHLPAAVFPIPFVCVPVNMCAYCMTVYMCVCADTGTMWYCTCTCCLVSVGTCVHVCNVYVSRLVHALEVGGGSWANSGKPHPFPHPSSLLPPPQPWLLCSFYGSSTLRPNFHPRRLEPIKVNSGGKGGLPGSCQ